MFIVCPQCETVFSLSDALFKPGKKARCSQCGNVFFMTESQQASAEPESGFGQTVAPVARHDPAPSKNYRKVIFGCVTALLVLSLAYGGWLIFRSFSGYDGGKDGSTVADHGSAPPDKQEEYERLINSISLDEIRQFLVENTQMGPLMVIQGVAVNISAGNKDYVTIDARVLDDKGTVLAQQRQLCGVPLTLFQLQSLSESEIKESLNNRITILTNNTNIPEGGKVPFVVVFPNPPQNMRTFEVRVIDARDTPPVQ